MSDWRGFETESRDLKWWLEASARSSVKTLLRRAVAHGMRRAAFVRCRVYADRLEWSMFEEAQDGPKELSEWKGIEAEVRVHMESMGEEVTEVAHRRRRAFARRCIAHGVRRAIDQLVPEGVTAVHVESFADAIECGEVDV